MPIVSPSPRTAHNLKPKTENRKTKTEIMKTSPIIRLENPPAGAIPATLEQLAALGFTPAEIEAGEKRGTLETRGPWGMCSAFTAPVERAEFGDGEGYRYGKKWVEFYAPRRMSNPRSCGYDLEGHISLAGRRVSAFTASQLFQLPDGRLVDCAVIFARSK